MILFACFLLLGVIILHFIFRAVLDGIDDIPQEYDMCEDCKAGWCDAFPGDKDCQEWKKKEDMYG